MFAKQSIRQKPEGAKVNICYYYVHLIVKIGLCANANLLSARMECYLRFESEQRFHL